jgi:hypothetical protein
MSRSEGIVYTMSTADFSGTPLQGVAWVTVIDRPTPPLVQVDVYCDQSAANTPPVAGTEGLLTVAATDEHGQDIKMRTHAVFRSVVRRSFGPTKPKMWQFTFFAASLTSP